MNNINKKYKKIALIILIIGFAFLISKNSFLEPIKTLFKNIKEKLFECFEPFECTDGKSNGLIDINPGAKTTPTLLYDSQKDFSYHSENLKTSEAEELYIYLQSLITPNHNMYDLTTASTKKYKSTDVDYKLLVTFLTKKLEKKVKNIKLEDNIYYFKNQSCLEIQPFQITGDYIINNKNFGKVKIQLELTFRFDQPNDIFMSQTIFNNYSGVFKINRAVLINHTTKDTNDNKNKKLLPVKLEKPLTYSKYNFNYEDNVENFGLDTVNSLIPDDIIITDYEKTSENITSQKIKV
jgi:hypothetical protein